MDGFIVILACFKYQFISVHGNLIQHPSNDKSIILGDALSSEEIVELCESYTAVMFNSKR